MSNDSLELLINDPRVVAVPVEECGETLVDLRDYPLLVSDDHWKVGRRSATQLHCREGVAERLVYAEQSLPNDVRLLILECHRSLKLQALYWENNLGKIRERYPNWSEERLANENAKFVAPPWVIPPHSTGGAVDLTLANHDGQDLDMGSAINDSGSLARTAAENLSIMAEENRQLLLSVMKQAGFVNYGYEWWHYSYGDRYWAYESGERVARYDSL